VSRIALRGTSRRWLRFLDRAATIALEVADGFRSGDPEPALAVVDVALEHDRMPIGLPGRAYRRTEKRRARMQAVPRALRDRLEVAS
jgi:hypothetical protein